MGDHGGDAVDFNDRYDQPVDRIEKHVADISHKVPNGERLKQREHKIGPRPNPVEAQCLPQILLRRHQINFCRKIEEAGQSNRTIDQEPSHFDASAFDLALKYIVQKARSKSKIGKDVANANLDQVWHNKIIALRHRLQHKSIDLAVELEDIGIYCFPGIILVTISLVDTGKRVKRAIE